MSPVLNCIPSSPPSDQEVYPKAGSVPSEESNRSPPEMVSTRPNGDFTESENSCCDDGRMETEDGKRSTPTNNNNNIPLNFKKSPSPNSGAGDGLPFEPPIRPWNSSPNFRHVNRDESVSPSSSSHRPSSCHRNSVSPDVSSEASRIPSQASSEAAHDAILSPDNFRSPKICAGDLPYDVSFPFHDNRMSSSGGFRLSNSFMNDPMNPYFRLATHPLNPFQPSPEFLGGSPFLGSSDPKMLLNNPSLGLISQQLHHLNGLSTNINKIPPVDLHRMSVQQLQFLQNLPNLLQPPPFAKYTDPKSQLSMLIQARKNPKMGETNGDVAKKDFNFPTGAKTEDVAKAKDRKPKSVDVPAKQKKLPLDESMEVDNYEMNHSDSDEVLSVGSASPPPNCPGGKPKSEKPHEGLLNGSNGSSSKFPNRTFNGTSSNKYFNDGSPVRLQDSVTNTKTGNASNRTLKFSIDNILKSDFGNEDIVKDQNLIESKKQKESERTSMGKKKPETEKEKPVDLSQENTNGAPGTEAPMLWPAWVYCTRYSDRPSSGPRTRRSKNKDKNPEEKRPRTAFSGDQLSRLKHEFAENRYLTERRRQDLARELGLNEAQIKIWFQNKRAKMKKARGEKNPLALQLMAQGLYNHSTIPLTKEEEEAAAAELSD